MNALTERHGRVLDAEGMPISGARVVIVASSVPIPEIALISDANGGFSLRLPAGRFTLRAHGREGTSGEIEVQGAPDDSEFVITIHR